MSNAETHQKNSRVETGDFDFVYDMSVIIPVYNKVATLMSCVASLDKQTAQQSSFEVILVNDGSVDESLSVCQMIATKRSNYTVIDKENGGVSSARNAGIRAARGKYLMFLDADDTISRSTIKSLVRAFQQQEDSIDLISYPIIYIDSATGKKSQHKRAKWLKEAKPYSLSEFPHIAQTTVNVCVKNRKESPWLFDESLEMGEDQLFITSVLSEKATIGSCPHAEYRYVRDATSASSTRNHPVFAFDGMIRLFEALLTMGDADERMKAYVDSMIIYNVNWRLKGNKLFPNFGDAGQREVNYQRLENVLKRIRRDSWLANPYMSQRRKIYLMNRYLPEFDDVSITYEDDKELLTFPDGRKYKLKIPLLMVDWFVSKSECLQLRGRVVGQTFLIQGKPRLIVRYNESSFEPTLTPSSYDLDGTREHITKTWDFEFDLPPLSCSPYEVHFSLMIDGAMVPAIRPRFQARRSNARAITQNAREFKSHRVELQTNLMRVFPKREYPILLKPVVAARRFARDLRRKERRKEVIPVRLRLPKALSKYEGRRIWLYSDLPRSETAGNALHQLLHDVAFDDGVERYYVTLCGEEVAANYPQLRDHIIDHRSWDHVVKYHAAELILASYAERSTFLPFDKAVADRTCDFIANQTLVYLQHGILHAHMPWYYSYDRLPFDYEVISTSFERENLTTKYLFPQSALIESGAPRMGAVQRNRMKTHRIVYVPSWRGYLVGGNAAERVATTEAFLCSSFYKGLSSFIEQLVNSGLLERYDYTLDLKLHPNFSLYKDEFVFESDRVRVKTDDIEPGDYDIAITDFSSYIYDFIYEGSLALFFIPDYTEFKLGFNHYSEIDEPCFKSFGSPCTKAEDAVLEVEKLFGMLLDSEGSEAVNEEAFLSEGFFFHRDGLNAQRLYEALIEITHAQRGVDV